MARPPQRGRVSLRDTIDANRATLAGYAALAGKPAPDFGPNPIKKRAPAVPSGIKPERDVSAEIVEVLKTHLSVAWFARFNSGQMVSTDGDATRHTAFYKLYMPGEKVKSRGLSDFGGMLTDGRMFAIEAKREGKDATTDQAVFLSAVASAGGISGVCRSGEDARALLDAA